MSAEQGEMSTQRTFNISEKSAFQSTENFSNFRGRKALVDAFLLNAKELEPTIDWVAVKRHIHHFNTTLKNTNDAFESYIVDIARPAATIARTMGWAMSQPEMVYLSGSQMAAEIESLLNKVQARIERVKTSKFVNERGEPDESKREAQLQPLEQIVAQLESTLQKMKSATTEYEERYIVKGDKDMYLDILNKLLSGKLSLDRKKVACALLAEGKVQEAHAYLSK